MKKSCRLTYKGSSRVRITFIDNIFPHCFDALLAMAHGRRPKINLSVLDMDILIQANQTSRWPEVWPKVVLDTVHNGTFLVPFVKANGFEPYAFVTAIYGLIKTIKEAPEEPPY